MPTDDETIVVANEFAHVLVRRIETESGDHIEISAPKRERSVQLNADTLWALAGEPVQTFTNLLSDAPLGIKEV
jgi:hypothetical protein